MTHESLQEISKFSSKKEPRRSERASRVLVEKQPLNPSTSKTKKEKCPCTNSRSRSSYAFVDEKEKMSIFTPFIQIGKAGALITSAVAFPVLTLVAFGGALGIPIPWWGDGFHGPLVFTGFMGSMLTMVAFEMD